MFAFKHLNYRGGEGIVPQEDIFQQMWLLCALKKISPLTADNQAQANILTFIYLVLPNNQDYPRIYTAPHQLQLGLSALLKAVMLIYLKAHRLRQ